MLGRLGAGFASGTLAAVVAVSTPVAAVSSTSSIGKNQVFVGLVNGRFSDATIDVVCPGPALTGQTGHPAGDQTLGLEPPPPFIPVTIPTGYTGSRGRFVVATFVSPVAAASSSTSSVELSQYGTVSIPTSLLVPCSGSGSVVFTPKPSSKTARSAKVNVSYVNLAVTPDSVDGPRSTATTLTFTQTDNGKTYKIDRGEEVNVELTGPTGFNWTEPVSSKSAVLDRTSGTAGSTATASFAAIGTGRATVSAVENADCYPECLIASRLFEVKISVRG